MSTQKTALGSRRAAAMLAGSASVETRPSPNLMNARTPMEVHNVIGRPVRSKTAVDIERPRAQNVPIGPSPATLRAYVHPARSAADGRMPRLRPRQPEG